jgi:hypothetical protein
LQHTKRETVEWVDLVAKLALVHRTALMAHRDE